MRFLPPPRPLNAGDMKARVTFQSKSISRQANGEQLVNWVDGDTVWAKVLDQSGRKFFKSDQSLATLDIEVRIRPKSGLTQDMRLTYKDEPYEIEEIVSTDAPDRHLQLLCVKGVRDGR